MRYIGAIPLTCCVLGTWQIYRLKWKEGILDEIRNGSAKTATAVLSTSTEMKNYNKYLLKGTWNEFRNGYALVGPRQHNNKLGFHIIYPFTLQSGEEVLVDVGWIPVDAKEKLFRDNSTLYEIESKLLQSSNVNLDRIRNGAEKSSVEPVKEGNISCLEVLLLPSENKSILQNLINANDADASLVRNSQEIGERLKLKSPCSKSIFFQAVPNAYFNTKTIPARKKINPETIPNNHLEYAITWFGTAIITGAMTIFRNGKI